MHGVFACRKNNLVENRKVEGVLLGLDHFPGDTAEQGVHICVYHLLPNRLHVLDRGQGRVLKFAGTDEKWTSFDDELLGVLIFGEVRDVDIHLSHVGDPLSSYIEECHCTDVMEESNNASESKEMKCYRGYVEAMQRIAGKQVGCP